jgi:hypothetical protein
MHLDSTQRHEAMTSPMEIAHNPLFTAREKIDMLNELKAEVTGGAANPGGIGFDPGEIDAAIQQIRLEVQDGDRPALSIDEAPYVRHDQ